MFQKHLFHNGMFGMEVQEIKLLQYFKQECTPLFTPEETRLICSLAIQTGKDVGRDSAGLLDSIIHKAELTMGQAETTVLEQGMEFDHMEGEPDMPDGLRGTVEYVDDQGQLHMKWDNGHSLAVVPNADDFHILRTQEQTEEPRLEKMEGGIADMDYEPMNLYVDYINAKVLPKIDYERLQADYGTEEKAYAKSVLNATEIFGWDTAGGYVLLPGVLQSKTTGELCIALLELDLQSSGEHCATDFLIRYGCISQFEPEMPDEVRKFIKDTYGAYDYGYTATLTERMKTACLTQCNLVE